MSQNTRNFIFERYLMEVFDTKLKNTIKKVRRCRFSSGIKRSENQVEV